MRPDDHKANNTTSSKSNIKIMGVGKLQHNSNYLNHKQHTTEQNKHNQKNK